MMFIDVYQALITRYNWITTEHKKYIIEQEKINAIINEQITNNNQLLITILKKQTNSALTIWKKDFHHIKIHQDNIKRWQLILQVKKFNEFDNFLTTEWIEKINKIEIFLTQPFLKPITVNNFHDIEQIQIFN